MLPPILLAAALATASAASATAQDAVPRRGPLQPDEVARVDGRSISRQAFHEYLSRSYARRPKGDAALQQLLVEALVAWAAESHELAVTEAEVDALLERLGARAQAAAGDDRSLEERLADPRRSDELRAAVTLLALQERVVALELSLPTGLDPTDEQLQAWLADNLAAAGLTERPLTDGLAADWAHGAIPRAAVGQLLERTLDDDVLTGKLTELLGMGLIEAAALEAGIEIRPDAIDAELVERERALHSNPEMAKVNYEQLLTQVEKRSLGELVASARFQAEVLLRQLTDIAWDDKRLRAEFERDKQRWGPDADFGAVRPMLLRESRLRTYQGLFRQSTIVRRF